MTPVLHRAAHDLKAARSTALGLRLLAFAAIIASAMPVSAAVISIDFDSLPGMSNSPGSAVPIASRLSTQLQPTTGATFSSPAGYVAVIAQNPGDTISAPNNIGGVTAGGAMSYGSAIDIVFSDPADSLTPATTSYVEIRGDTSPAGGATATMEAFDLFDSLIGTVTAGDVASGLTLSLAVPGIHRIHLTQNSALGPFDGTIGFDNLRFESVAVPEPSTFALAGVAVTALGAYRLRRHRR